MLRGKGLEEFLPTYRARRQWSDRIKVLDLPLFPGYLFCRIDLSKRLPLLTTPGFLYLVGKGMTPEPVDDKEVMALQSVVRSGLPAHAVAFRRCRAEGSPGAGAATRDEGRSRQNRRSTSDLCKCNAPAKICLSASGFRLDKHHGWPQHHPRSLNARFISRVVGTRLQRPVPVRRAGASQLDKIDGEEKCKTQNQCA